MNTPRLKLPVVMFGVLIVQVCVLQRIQVEAVHADALLLVAVAGGVAAGPERGALLGFAAGLVADLFLETPLGLSALVFCLVGFTVGALQSSMIRTAFWITPITALLGSGAGVILFGLAGAVVGQTQLVRPRLVTVALVVAVLNAIIAIPVVSLVSWAMRPSGSDRAYAR